MSYIPNQGDIVYLDFDPQAGHEQKSRRNAEFCERIPTDLIQEVFDILYGIIEIE